MREFHPLGTTTLTLESAPIVPGCAPLCGDRGKLILVLSSLAHDPKTHVWNWTVCAVHIDGNAVATVVGESDGMASQRDEHKTSEHIESEIIGTIS